MAIAAIEREVVTRHGPTRAKVFSVFPSFDFSPLATDAVYYVEDQRARQAEAVKRGIGNVLSIAGYMVGDEPLTERGLTCEISAAFGYSFATSEDICRLLVGNSPAGHVFKRGRNGILIRHNGPLGNFAAMAA